MNDQAFTDVQMAQLRLAIKEGVEEAFADAGLRIDEGTHQDEAREDFRFVRRLRKTWDGAVVKTGTFILLGLLGIVATIAGMGFWAWINKGGQ